jgi:hypothetical protein
MMNNTMVFREFHPSLHGSPSLPHKLWILLPEDHQVIILPLVKTNVFDLSPISVRFGQTKVNRTEPFRTSTLHSHEVTPFPDPPIVWDLDILQILVSHHTDTLFTYWPIDLTLSVTNTWNNHFKWLFFEWWCSFYDCVNSFTDSDGHHIIFLKCSLKNTNVVCLNSVFGIWEVCVLFPLQQSS